MDSEAWRRAVLALRSALAVEDCALVQLEVTQHGAHLMFITRDGRRAERDLLTPDELRPTVVALLVTVPAHDTVTSAETPPTHETLRDGPAPSERDTLDDRIALPPQPPPAHGQEPPQIQEPTRGEFGTIFSVQAGARGGARALFSPVLSGSGSLVLDRWELGITSAVEFQYFDLKGHTESRRSSAVLAGVLVGYREPLGGVDLLVGARLSFAALLHAETNRGEAEARGGFFVGAAFPRTARTRYRIDIGADARTDQGDTPITPGWAVSSMLGIEIGGT